MLDRAPVLVIFGAVGGVDVGVNAVIAADVDKGDVGVDGARLNMAFVT